MILFYHLSKLILIFFINYFKDQLYQTTSMDVVKTTYNISVDSEDFPGIYS